MISSVKYHVARAGQPSRAMALQEINMGLASGEIRLDDDSWTPGHSRWESVKNIPGVLISPIHSSPPGLDTSNTYSKPSKSAGLMPARSSHTGSQLDQPARHEALSFWGQPTPSVQPAVWPAVTYIFGAILFTPVFGSWMIAQNHRATGESTWRTIADFWTCAWSVTVVFAAGVWLGRFAWESASTWLAVSGSLWIIWFFTCALPHRRFLQARSFEVRWRTDWGKPVGLGFLGWATLFVGYLVSH